MNNQPQTRSSRWSWLSRRWPLIVALVVATGLAFTIGEPMAWPATLIWSATYMVIGWFAAGEGLWGEMGRHFMSSRAGRLVQRVCTKVFARVLGTTRAAAALCEVLTILTGEIVFVLYRRWLQPDEV